MTSSSLSGAGDAFDAKFKAMLKDYAAFAPEKTIVNKCFVWLQGESEYTVITYSGPKNQIEKELLDFVDSPYSGLL